MISQECTKMPNHTTLKYHKMVHQRANIQINKRKRVTSKFYDLQKFEVKFSVQVFQFSAHSHPKIYQNSELLKVDSKPVALIFLSDLSDASFHSSQLQTKNIDLMTVIKKSKLSNIINNYHYIQFTG